ncbi:MAG: Lrp/AsnC family transcriptional regulator [Sediminispirochaetaceae bacterium]
MAEKKFEMDATDIQILRELQEDGRISYRTLAEKLDISDGTVRSRVNRMLDSGLLKISAMIDPFFFKNSIIAHIGMQLESRTHLETMKKISALEGVLNVCNTAGEYDLFVEVFLKSREELNSFLFEVLPEVGGIKNTHTWVYLDGRNKWIEAKM